MNTTVNYETILSQLDALTQIEPQLAALRGLGRGDLQCMEPAVSADRDFHRAAALGEKSGYLLGMADLTAVDAENLVADPQTGIPGIGAEGIVIGGDDDGIVA